MARFVTFLAAREKVRVTLNVDEVKLVLEATHLDETLEGTFLVMELPDWWSGSLRRVILEKGAVIRVQQSVSEVLQALNQTAER